LSTKSSLFVYPSRVPWHIITAQRAVHIIKGGKPPLHLITRQRAFSLRLDDIQPCGLMICNSFGIDDMQRLRR